MTMVEDLPWMIVVAASGVAVVLIASYWLILKRPMLEKRLIDDETTGVENQKNKRTSRRASKGFLLFSLEYLTDRKNIAVYAVLFPSMLVLVIFSLGMPFYLRASIVLTAIGCNVIRMRIEKRKIMGS